MASSTFALGLAALLFGTIAAAPAAAQVAANPNWTVTSGQSASGFGEAVGSAGDVNGDGYDDVIVVASTFSGGQGWEGKAFVYHGSPTGLGTTPGWTFESDQAFASLGAVAGAGDVDGDGFDDVIVGARAFDGPHVNGGRVWLIRGSAAGLSATPSWIADGSVPHAQIGYSLAGGGDLNGDGFADIVVGSYSMGSFSVYHGSLTGPSLVPDATITGPPNSAFAESIANAGDVNGDGHDDVIVGASQYDNGQLNEGLALVYLGSVTGMATTPVWAVESDVADAQFGCSVDGAGDVNGDGYDDVIIGAWRYPQGGITYGDAFVYSGGPAGLALTPAWTPGPQQSASSFGFTVAGAGDVNGDGYDDVIVGADAFNATTVNDGRAYSYLGSASGLSSIADWSAQGTGTHVYFGLAVSGAGDVNGDGLHDVIVGGQNFDNGNQRAWVFLGCAGCGATAPYHPGKPNGLFPRLSSTAPVLGTAQTLTLHGGAPGVPAYLLAGFTPAALPFGGGTLLVVPTFTIFYPNIPAGGTLTMQLVLPPNAALAGLHVYFQCVFFLPGGSGLQNTVQTNGLHWTLGD